MHYTINIKSFTAAQKARSYLQKHGIGCSVERITNKGQGCGFSLRFADSRVGKAEVCALLDKIGITCDLPR